MSTVPIHDDGQWISGPCLDPRPEFSPAALVFEILDLLERAGVHVDPPRGNMPTAMIACADVLRALGVTPASAPERRP